MPVSWEHDTGDTVLPLCSLAIAGTEATAEHANGEDGRTFMVLPGAFYSQETTLGFAAFGSSTLPLRGTSEGTWPSSLNAAVVVTLRKQVSVAAWPTLYLGADNAWILSGSYIASHFPTQYYGLGDRSDGVSQGFTRRWVTTDTTVLRKAHGRTYVGPTHVLSVTEVGDFGLPQDAEGPADWTGDDQLGRGLVPGEEGGLVHGVGAVLRMENRDNPQSTRTGTFVEAKAVAHPELLGTTNAYVLGRLDTRGFVTVGPDVTFGAQWLTELRRGDVPFTHMGQLGGDNVLRGLFEGRYRDLSLTAVQGEARIPVVWKLRAVAFAGVGQVFGTEPLRVHPTWSAGGGLRFELDEASHNTLRLDVGGGRDGFGFIFNFGEAF